jgi:hypothetical protein
MGVRNLLAGGKWCTYLHTTSLIINNIKTLWVKKPASVTSTKQISWFCAVLQIGCAGFAKKIFSLRSEMKRNGIRIALFSHVQAKTKNQFFACFRFKLFASLRSEMKNTDVSHHFASSLFLFASFSL